MLVPPVAVVVVVGAIAPAADPADPDDRASNSFFGTHFETKNQ